MPFELYSDVALARDIPEEDLHIGDVGTIVERLTQRDREDGYAIEIFTVLGETLKVVVVPASGVRMLTPDDVLAARARS